MNGFLETAVMQKKTIGCCRQSTGYIWDRFSLLIDDVERFCGTAADFSLALLDRSLPHGFFRLAVS